MSYEDESEKLQPYSWAKLLIQPRRKLLIPELLFTTGVTTLVAQSGEGKTTLANSLGLTIATAGLWNGQPIELRPMVWAAGEGQDDMRPMYEAWMQAHPKAPQPKGFWLDEAVDFSDERKTTQFIELLADMKIAEAVIVPDALADIIGELDENTSKDINQVYRNVWRVVRASKSCFLIPHHSGWHEKRERGSTAIRAKSDIVVQITNFDVDANIITLKHHKRRSGRKLKEFSFKMDLVAVNGYPQPIPIVTGVRLDQSIPDEPTVADQHNAHTLVEIIVKYFPEGATFTELHKQSKMGKTTFYSALKWAEHNGLLGGGGGRGQRYNLQSNKSVQSSVQRLVRSGVSNRPPEPTEPSNLGSDIPKTNQVRTNEPNASCESADTTENNKNLSQINEAESSISDSHNKVTRLYSKIQDAIAHVDESKRKRSGEG